MVSHDPLKNKIKSKIKIKTITWETLTRMHALQTENERCQNTHAKSVKSHREFLTKTQN